MSKKSFMPHGDEAKATWINNEDEKLPGYATKFSIDKKGVDSNHNDRAAFNYALLLVESVKTFEHQCITYKDSIRNGKETNVIMDIPVFVPPANPPIAVMPGIFRRAGKMVKTFKAHVSYTESIGKDMGFIGSEYTGRDNPDDIQTKLTLKETAGKIKIKYVKGGIDSIKLESKRGAETEFTLLDKLSLTTYTDERETLLPGVPEIRQFRAWCIIKDKVVGKVSDTVSITVTPA